MQLVGDLRERGAEILTKANLYVAAARFLCHARETRVRPVRHQRRLQPSRAEAGHLRPLPATAHPDRVDHHALFARVLDHLDLTDELRTEAGRSAVLPVAQHQNDRAAIVLAAVLEHVEPLVDRPPQRRRRIGRNRARQRGAKLTWIAGEGRTDADIVSESPDAYAVVGAQPPEELFAALAQQLQIALHTARDVEQHDETDGLR